MKNENQSNDTAAMSGVDSSALFGDLILLASRAPTKVPDWFVGEQGETYHARVLYGKALSNRDLHLCSKMEMDKMIEDAGRKAEETMVAAHRKYPFPFEAEYQKEREFQWPWYYASELIKRAAIYFPNVELWHVVSEERANGIDHQRLVSPFPFRV